LIGPFLHAERFLRLPIDPLKRSQGLRLHPGLIRTPTQRRSWNESPPGILGVVRQDDVLALKPPQERLGPTVSKCAASFTPRYSTLSMPLCLPRTMAETRARENNIAFNLALSEVSREHPELARSAREQALGIAAKPKNGRD